jgi:LmeA-like phospholipid-binding
MGRAFRIVAAAAAVVLLLALAQLLLPKIAVDRVRSRVGRYGTVRSVSVKAWPAIKLLWGSVDSVKVQARNLRITPERTAALLWEGRDSARIDMRAERVREGPLELRDARLQKRGRALQAQALIDAADVRAALPPGFDVKLVSSSGGRVRVRASGGLFGVGASVEAEARAEGGRLVARALGALGAVRLTLFSDPHVYVEGVGASVAAGSAAQPSTYALSMRASLR